MEIGGFRWWLLLDQNPCWHLSMSLSWIYNVQIFFFFKWDLILFSIQIENGSGTVHSGRVHCLGPEQMWNVNSTHFTVKSVSSRGTLGQTCTLLELIHSLCPFLTPLLQYAASTPGTYSIPSHSLNYYNTACFPRSLCPGKNLFSHDNFKRLKCIWDGNMKLINLSGLPKTTDVFHIRLKKTK